jgi:Rrf2 family protein
MITDFAIYDMDRTVTRRATYTPFLIHCALRRAPWRLLLLPFVIVSMLAYVAKLMRLLLKGGIVVSTRGHQGGYQLSRPAAEISVADVVEALGGGLFPEGFCTDHRGTRLACVHSQDCAIRSVFSALDTILSEALARISLSDLLIPESRVGQLLSIRLDASARAGASSGPRAA